MAEPEKIMISRKAPPKKPPSKRRTRKKKIPEAPEEWMYPLDYIVGQENIKSAMRRYLVQGGGEFKSAILWSEGELGGLELAEAVGAEMGGLVHRVDCPVLWGSEYVELFDTEVSKVEKYLEHNETVLLIFKDFEYIAHTDDVNYYAPRTLFRFLSALKSPGYKNLYVIALTSDIGTINSNIYRRFDLHLELEPYDENEMKTLIGNDLAVHDAGMTGKDMTWLSGKVLGFDLLALRNVIKRAKQEALHREGVRGVDGTGRASAADGSVDGAAAGGIVGAVEGKKTKKRAKTAMVRSDLETALKNSRESHPFAVTAELISEMKFHDIISPASKKLMEIIGLYFDNRDMVKEYRIKPLNGILLHGPPGTGKTSLAKAVAHHIKGAFFNVSMAETTSKWFGEFEKNISQTFITARAIAKKRTYPSVLFFDELDSWSSRTDSDVMDRALSVLLTELDGLTSDHNVLAIAATNRHSKLEKSLIRPGRFDLQIEVKLPTAVELKRIFRKYLDDIPGRSVNLNKLASLTKGLSGAEIENIVELAKIEKILATKLRKPTGKKEQAGKTAKGGPGGKTTKSTAKSGKKDESDILKITTDDMISVMVNEKNYYTKLSRNPAFKTLSKKKYLGGKKRVGIKDVDSLYV